MCRRVTTAPFAPGFAFGMRGSSDEYRQPNRKKRATAANPPQAAPFSLGNVHRF
jgi:hypothetical protein